MKEEEEGMTDPSLDGEHEGNQILEQKIHYQFFLLYSFPLLLHEEIDRILPHLKRDLEEERIDFTHQHFDRTEEISSFLPHLFSLEVGI